SVTSFSLLGSGSVFAVTVVKGRCFNDQVRPLVQLALADFLAAAAALLSMAIIQLLPPHLFIFAYYLCPYGVILAMMFYNVSFLMVMVYAYETNRAIKGWREMSIADVQQVQNDRGGRKKVVKLIYSLVWLIPLLGFFIKIIPRIGTMRSVSPEHMVILFKKERGNRGYETLFCNSCIVLIHKTSDVCLGYENTENEDLVDKILFFLYVLAVISCCSFLYCRMKLWCQRTQQRLFSPEKDTYVKKNIRSIYLTFRFIQLVFLGCWIPAFILSIISFTKVSPRDIYPLYVIQAFTMSLQGFMDSLAYGWLRRNFREMVIGERTPLTQDWQEQAFYETSLDITE
uniref:G-protein coupled receptors family 1 profile domain-containing protein n=1 Tax=Latimeria chalumnae TaxID=7897 RepID=H3AUJ0_LATCH